MQDVPRTDAQVGQEKRADPDAEHDQAHEDRSSPNGGLLHRVILVRALQDSPLERRQEKDPLRETTRGSPSMSKSMENKIAAIYLRRSTEDESSAVTHCCSECADALITVKFRRDLAYLPGPPVWEVQCYSSALC